MHIQQPSPGVHPITKPNCTPNDQVQLDSDGFGMDLDGFGMDLDGLVMGLGRIGWIWMDSG